MTPERAERIAGEIERDLFRAGYLHYGMRGPVTWPPDSPHALIVKVLQAEEPDARPWPTEIDVARLIIRRVTIGRLTIEERMDEALDAARAIRALFPDHDRLLADFRWLADQFRYQDGAGRRSTGPDLEIELRDWDAHVAPWLAPREEPR